MTTYHHYQIFLQPPKMIIQMIQMIQFAAF